MVKIFLYYLQLELMIKIIKITRASNQSQDKKRARPQL